jgi:hypothetical protein
MPYEVLDVPQQWFPPAAAGVAVSTGAGVWAPNPAWTELVADTGADPILLTAVVGMRTANQWGSEQEVEVGIGAAGAEVVLATSHILLVNFQWSEPGGIIQRFLPPLDMVPAHSRLVVRVRGGNLWAWALAVGYVVRPAGALTVEVATSAVKTLPPAANAKTVVGNALAWTNSAFVEITPGLASAVDLLGLALGIPGWVGDWFCEIDIATGAAGAEIVRTTVSSACGLNSSQLTTGEQTLINPLHIPTGTRIAMRARQTAAGAGTWSFALHYREVAP